MTDRGFVKVAALAAFVSVLTTIGVHYITFPAETFAQRLELRHHTGYIAHRWMIILHCMCVIVSMTGLLAVRRHTSLYLLVLGMICYTVFGFAEITRMMSVLHYLNPLREAYVTAADPETQKILFEQIHRFTLAGNTLFAVFAFAFMMGNLFYGLALLPSSGLTRWLAMGFLYWALTGFAGMANQYLGWEWVSVWTEWNGKVFQVVFRGVIGGWMWRAITNKL